MVSLECGPKTGTVRAMQSLKPRARPVPLGQWIVHAGGVQAFGASLDQALTYWQRAYLLKLIEARHARS